jgi:glycosyltransferase involved in cell wall biosynthesis
VEWLYVDLPGWMRKLKKRMPFGVQFYYAFWQWLATGKGRKAHESVGFDAVHHLTYGVSWLAPPSALLGIRMIWGPIGGGDIVPTEIIREEKFRFRVQEFFYRILTHWLPLASPLGWIARNRCAAIIFRTRSLEAIFPATPRAKRYVICETATTVTADRRVTERRGPLRVVAVGRMVYWKGFRYALLGFLRFLERGGEGELTMLGHGPEYETLRRYRDDHRLGKFVKMPGHVAHAEVQRVLDESDVLLHPSFREGGSWGVLEAMTKGLPVICMRASGMADMVDAESGIPIDAQSPDQATDGIADALTRLAADPRLRAKLGSGARERAINHYSWAQRGRQIRDVYRDALGLSNDISALEDSPQTSVANE